MIDAFAMHAPPPRTVPQCRLVWLLWLALLLPIAQVTATWHALSHTGVATVDAAGGKQAPHTAHCDLCLSAAAVSGGALAGEPAPLPHPAAHHAAPQAASSGVWLASPTRAYRSRAPPFASR